MKNLFVLIMMAMTVVACSKGSTSSARKKTTLTPEIMDSLMAQQSITCPSGDCPESVARLFIINFNDAENSSLCTGTLVGDKKILTNSHCLEHDTLQEACDGFYAVFKTSRYGYEIARCSQILFRNNHVGSSRSDLADNDYALIELDRSVYAKPAPINRVGFKAGERVFPYVIDHISGAEARIVKLDCTVSSQTSNNRDNVLEHCPGIPGNSGSGIMNTKGEIAGVLYAAEDPGMTEETEISLRTESDAISLGFPMSSVLEDLDTWL